MNISDLKWPDKIGCKHPDSVENFYDYLINDYIPGQGYDDMVMFIKLGFSPDSYILWKLYSTGHMKQDFIEPFKKRVFDVFGLELSGGK
jgi:hypothetical protein